MINQLCKSVLLACALTSGAAMALPVDLDNAGNYTLLATGTNIHHGQPMYGDLILGSEAYIYGDVGARNSLNMAHGAVVYGDADFGSLTQNPGSSIEGDASVQGAAFWDSLYSDVKSASLAAKALSGVNAGYIASTQTFTSQGNLSVFNILGLNLSAGNSLTLSGDADDVFIINVDYYGFMLGGGASIILDGLSAENVLFNMHGALTNGHVNVAAGSMQGTYISPDAYMQLGDGLNLDGVRFLGAGISGNLQDVYGFTPPVVVVSEPSMLLLIGLGLMGLGAIRRRTN
ncbi:PEP-CTERM sorting domain-containing protein [Cellvibrio sp. NN19]|uniref:PEP-CTERM sorting domain-containing protein n=1 Tax=Cellvibrio chitinivorans TaxID=3102792 RepID=UPI002B411DCC|nr:PEP-CTERM sorting domain-containing protein [Cellvibrio sp. NN19]